MSESAAAGVREVDEAATVARVYTAGGVPLPREGGTPARDHAVHSLQVPRELRPPPELLVAQRARLGTVAVTPVQARRRRTR